jgi:hypothetical protein
VRRDRMFNLGPDLRLGAVLRTLALVHHAAVTIAALMKSRAFGVCAGSPPAGSDRPVALSATLVIGAIRVGRKAARCLGF